MEMEEAVDVSLLEEKKFTYIQASREQFNFWGHRRQPLAWAEKF